MGNGIPWHRTTLSTFEGVYFVVLTFSKKGPYLGFMNPHLLQVAIKAAYLLLHMIINSSFKTLTTFHIV